MDTRRESDREQSRRDECLLRAGQVKCGCQSCRDYKADLLTIANSKVWGGDAAGLGPAPAPKPKDRLGDAAARKAAPLKTGCLDYFPDALLAVAAVSKVGNDQHNPGQPLHWAREKSDDHGDCAARHLVDAGTIDTDGTRHTAKAAWRILALLQLEIEASR